MVERAEQGEGITWTLHEHYTGQMRLNNQHYLAQAQAQILILSIL